MPNTNDDTNILKRRRSRERDTDTSKVSHAAALFSLLAKVRKHPSVVALLAGGAGGGGKWLADTLNQTPQVAWVVAGAGALAVLGFAALDYLSALFTHGQKLGEDVADIRDMVADGFDAGDERFKVIEQRFREHLADHPPASGKYARRRSAGKIEPVRDTPTSVSKRLEDSDDAPVDMSDA